MKRILLLVGVLAIVSCKSKLLGDGGGLSPKLMQQILVDVSMAESYSLMVKDSLHKGGTKNLDSLAVYYKSIFAHYKVTPAQFKESIDWYKAHPDKFDTLYTAVQADVTNLQNRTGLPPTPPKVMPHPISFPPPPPIKK